MNIFNLPLGIVLDKEGNILLLKRTDRNVWEPIKGGIEEGETPEEAIKREFFEETGITENTISKFENLGVFSETKELESGRLKINRYYFVFRLVWIKPEISLNHVTERGEDHNDFGWFNRQEIDGLTMEYKESFLKVLDSVIF